MSDRVPADDGDAEPLFGGFVQAASFGQTRGCCTQFAYKPGQCCRQRRKLIRGLAQPLIKISCSAHLYLERVYAATGRGVAVQHIAT